MLSAVISSVHSYPAMPLARQQVHQRYVHSGPLVLGAAPVKFPTPTADRDQTVSRRFEPSSRTTLNGEQPYPWDRRREAGKSTRRMPVCTRFGQPRGRCDGRNMKKRADSFSYFFARSPNLHQRFERNPSTHEFDQAVRAA